MRGHATIRYLEHLFGPGAEHNTQNRAPRDGVVPQSMGPTLVKLEDPVADIEDIAARLDDGQTMSAQPHSWLEKRAGRNSKIQMRDCCMALAQKLDSRLAQLKVPSDHVCDRCGTIWRVQYAVRETRTHG